ncbi:ABC transporter permease, partial [Mesorhizobium sp. M00.F.Ca.ET.186.01.1.1]
MSRGIWFGISIAIFFAAWEAVCRIFDVPPFILPPPSTVVVALWDLRESLLGVHLWATLKEVLLGLSVSIVFGVLLAFAMSMSK